MATPVWQFQGGTANDDGFNAVAMGSDGSSLFAGFADLNATAVTTYWTAMKLDADGTLLWEWQDEIKGDDSDLLYGASMGPDGSVALAGTVDGEFQVIRLDADGNFVWRFKDGTDDYSAYADGIAMGDDGSVVVAGGAAGEWDIPNVGGWDFAAFKLDADMNLLWKWQDGTAEADLFNDLTLADNGSVVITGSSGGDFMSASDIGSYYPGEDFTEVELNFVAIKLDAGGDEVWRWQDGPRGEDNHMLSVSMTEEGSFVLAGRAEGVWSGDSSAGGLDFVAVKLDADGNEVWRWQDGTSGDDRLYAVMVQADGTILLGGSTEGAFDGVNAGGNDFVIVRLDDDGREIWRWQGGSPSTDVLPGDDFINSLYAGADGRIVFAGKTWGSWAATNLGDGDFVAAMLDTSALRTPSPSVAATLDTSALRTPSPTIATPRPTVPSPPSASTTAPPAPTQQSSDMMPIIAGVASAVVGVVLIALGCFLWKRNHSSNDDASKTGLFSAAVVDNSRTLAPPRHTLPPPSLPPSYAQVLAASAAVAAAKRVEVGGSTAPPFPDKFVRDIQPAVKPTLTESTGGGAREVLYAQRLTDATPNEEKDGDGDGSGARGGGGGRRVPIVQGDAVLTTPAVKHGGGRGGGGGGGGVASVEARTDPTMQADEDGRGEGGSTWPGAGAGGGDGGGGDAIEQGGVVDASLQQAWNTTASTVDISTGEHDELAPAYEERGAVGPAFVDDERTPAFDPMGDASSTRRRGASDGLLLGQAVGDVAQELARNCHIPGVSEAAAAVSILANLVMNTQDSTTGTEASLRRCRSIVLMLKRAAKVLGKGGDTTGKAERAMMEDVHDAIFDLVELIKTYQSKNKLSQVMTSTLFRRRQDEMGAVVDRAILGLQLGLHVQVGNDVSAVKKDVGAFKDGMHLYQGSIDEAQSRYFVEARKARRQRKLDQIEIPEDHVAITGELLGKGGFGEVFLADYNGRNAAAKVLYISHELCRRGENDVLDGVTSSQLKTRRGKDQRKAFLRELDAMTRLRSPYTVNVYGAVTCLPDRLVLVMELLAGGDLRTLLSNCEHPLAQQQSRQILGDICAGMAFLHSKDAVHGDVKSANVLLDGTGRAKIGDFGTSRWTHHTMSTGLATFTTKSGKNTQMSLAWSAPEVLHAAGSTKASDVYSFGIVVWEVLSRELPWEAVTHPRDIYIRVVLNDLRPTIPDDAPAEIADVATACWVSQPGDRPTFSAMMEDMKENGWNE